MKKRNETVLALVMGAAGVAMLTLDMRMAVGVVLSSSVPTWGGVLVFIALLVVGSWWVYECYQYVMGELVYRILTLERRCSSVKNKYK